ncbi:hypothetical protein GCM10020220_036470 [Nonomuraea rubra]|uniref:hypothetical protein n=1 Tax=Nonomuraea rubra TaxID=46180 RepID=UPI0031EB0E1C
MSVNDDGGDNDSGAFGVLLNGDDNVVTGNTITGSFAKSADYGIDGAAVEIFNGDRNTVTHNISQEQRDLHRARRPEGQDRHRQRLRLQRRHLLPQPRLLPHHPRLPPHRRPRQGTIAVHNSVYLPPRTPSAGPATTAAPRRS